MPLQFNPPHVNAMLVNALFMQAAVLNLSNNNKQFNWATVLVFPMICIDLYNTF